VAQLRRVARFVAVRLDIEKEHGKASIYRGKHDVMSKDFGQFYLEFDSNASLFRFKRRFGFGVCWETFPMLDSIFAGGRRTRASGLEWAASRKMVAGRGGLHGKRKRKERK
jgi:hypothetical protein